VLGSRRRIRAERAHALGVATAEDVVYGTVRGRGSDGAVGASTLALDSEDAAWGEDDEVALQRVDERTHVRNARWRAMEQEVIAPEREVR
jgi:hypothetical protein